MDLSLPEDLKPSRGLLDVYEQCVDDAAFFWVLRSVAISKPNYYREDIVELEQRIEAQLDALMTAVDTGWFACEQALEFQEPGEVFTATVTAMRSHEMTRIQKAVEVGLSSKRTYSGLISAMGWLPEQLVKPWIERFLNGKDMKHKYLGLGICSVRRFDPGEQLNQILQRSDCLQHADLHARALRLIGELRRQDLMPALNVAMTSDNEEIKFWASWSAILLGHKEAVRNLQSFVFQANPNRERAIQIAFRVLPIEQARGWISNMAGDKAHMRSVIRATGVLGDPHAVNWLIGKMQEPERAKIAGEAFSSITGVDFGKHQLDVEQPNNLGTFPNDDPNDDNVEMDEDEDLPYPDVEKVAALWRNQGQNFIVGQRYFLGRPITNDLLRDKLQHGTQRQQHAASLELALIDHTVPLPNTKARILTSSS